MHLETHNLAGSSVWSMLKWWCYRYSFYYPSSSNSHCQLSPVHVMQAMKLEVTDAYLSNEALRVASKSGNEYTDLEFFMDVINSDVTGLYLNFEGEEINITDDMDQMIESMMVPRGGSDIDDHKEDTKSQSEAVTPRVALLRNQMSKRISESLRKGKAHRKKMASRHQHRHVKAVSSPQWHDVMDVFVHEDKSLRWFRQSLRLLTELCYGGNLNVQEKATILVPAEFILHVLQVVLVHFLSCSVFSRCLSFSIVLLVLYIRMRSKSDCRIDR